MVTILFTGRICDGPISKNVCLVILYHCAEFQICIAKCTIRAPATPANAGNMGSTISFQQMPEEGVGILHKLEALRERRPPWPRQIITPILSTVKMLSLGCDRLPTPLKKKKKKKKKRVLDHYLHHDLGMLPLLRCFLLIYSSYNTQITTKI